MRRISCQLVLLLTFCFGGATPGIAQFDPTNFDRQLLEHAIKTLIDSTRLAHNLPALYNDSTLYAAAVHHANYLVAKKALSHEEPEYKPYRTPQDRARAFGAPENYLVGENIVFAPYNASVKVKDKLFETNNYREIARCLVYSWVNSKGHFANILTPGYQVTGLAIGVDPQLKRIYACQKFAQVMYTYSFSENTTLFPYSTLDTGATTQPTAAAYPKADYPFKLRDDKTEGCNACKPIWENYPPLSVRVSNNNFILRVEDAAFVQALVQGKHDGFAIEIVPFDAFACGNPAYELEPSRRNGLQRTSGQLLEPVYRDELVKGFKKRTKVKNLSFVNYLFSADSVPFFKRFGRYKLINFTAQYFELRLGKVPKDLNGWWHHNLVYINNRQLCHFVYLTNYPGELDTSLVDVAYFPPVPVNDYTIQTEQFTDTLELFYQSGKTVTSGGELTELVKRFTAQQLTIRAIEIEGFCSVEGDSLSNERLHKQRADNILAALQAFADPATRYQVKSQVAWDHFYSSVREHPKWKFLYPQSRKEIRSYLSDSKNEQPTDILARERKVKVVILAEKEFSPKTANYYLQRDLKTCFYKDQRGQIRCSDPEKLERIYEKAYYLTTVDTLTQQAFLSIDFPNVVGGFSHRLEHDKAFYRYHLLHESATKTELARLESAVERAFEDCGMADHLSAPFHYLSACLIVKKMQTQGQKITAKDPNIQKAFNRLNDLLNAYQLDSTFLFNVSKANLNIINVLCTTINPDQIYEYSDVINYSVIQLIQYYRSTNQLDADRAFQLAQTLCYFKNIPLAVDLCSEFLHDNRILQLYLPLAYTHTSYLSSDHERDFEQAFHQLLLEARARLTPREWCRLFYGHYGIPFQVMDNAALREQFCATCPNRVTEVFGED